MTIGQIPFNPGHAKFLKWNRPYFNFEQFIVNMRVDKSNFDQYRSWQNTNVHTGTHQHCCH